MQWYVVGAVAAALTTFGYVPQAIKMLRTKQVKDLSPVTLIQISAGMSLWTLYGIHLKDAIIIGANSVGLLVLLITLWLYLMYSRRRPAQ